MKRIDIEYGGEHYSIADREMKDVQAEISEGIDSGSTYWLEVNSGEGRPRRAMLALSEGTPIALTAARED